MKLTVGSLPAGVVVSLMSASDVGPTYDDEAGQAHRSNALSVLPASAQGLAHNPQFGQRRARTREPTVVRTARRMDLSTSTQTWAGPSRTYSPQALGYEVVRPRMCSLQGLDQGLA